MSDYIFMEILFLKYSLIFIENEKQQFYVFMIILMVKHVVRFFFSIVFF